MKKLIAILLSVLCLFSALACPALAGADDLLEDVLESELGVTKEEGEIDDVLMYGIHYEMQTLTTVSITYMPSPTITFKQPVTAKVTLDTPLSIDYQFVCWKEEKTGKLYYPGDEIEVTGEITLLAVWEEKTDKYPRVIRVIINALETLNRLISKFLGVYDAYEEVEKEYGDTTTTVPETTTQAAA